MELPALGWAQVRGIEHSRVSAGSLGDLGDVLLHFLREIGLDIWIRCPEALAARVFSVLPGAAALWRAGCSWKSCGCRAAGPESAFDLGAWDGALVYSSTCMERFLQAMRPGCLCSKSPMNLHFLLSEGFRVPDVVAALSYVLGSFFGCGGNL